MSTEDEKAVAKAKAIEAGMKYHEDSMKHWRAWGSWFSWGSPVGLGLFLLAIGGFIWLIGQTFGWN